MCQLALTELVAPERVQAPHGLVKTLQDGGGGWTCLLTHQMGEDGTHLVSWLGGGWGPQRSGLAPVTLLSWHPMFLPGSTPSQ